MGTSPSTFHAPQLYLLTGFVSLGSCCDNSSVLIIAQIPSCLTTGCTPEAQHVDCVLCLSPFIFHFGDFLLFLVHVHLFLFHFCQSSHKFSFLLVDATPFFISLKILNVFEKHY